MTVTQLTTTQLGRTGLQITRVGFGAWAIGGGNWEFGWGPQDDDESIAAIHHALAQGINWIDTAAAYGFGRSEQIVGRALDGLRERPYVLTKCSLLEGPDRTVTHRLKRDSILREAEASLTRLGVDAIDVYQIHWPIPAQDIAEGWAALADHYDTTPGAIAVAWALRNRAVDGAIVGFRRPDQIAPILTAAALDLTNHDIAEIEGSTR
jgi:aryl-alcohol dehydrogenase-like predicted oxidoreductase